MWLAAGLLALGFALTIGVMPPSAAMHILTKSTIATMIKGLMSRAALGHTGHEKKAPPAVVMAYVLLALAVTARLAGLLLDTGLAQQLLIAAGILWTAAFGLFGGVIAPFVLRPRIDGRPR